MIRFDVVESSSESMNATIAVWMEHLVESGHHICCLSSQDMKLSCELFQCFHYCLHALIYARIQGKTFMVVGALLEPDPHVK